MSLRVYYTARVQSRDDRQSYCNVYSLAIFLSRTPQFSETVVFTTMAVIHDIHLKNPLGFSR